MAATWGRLRRLTDELEVDPIRVHDAVCDQVQVKERAKVSEAVSQLLLGVCSGNDPGGCGLLDRAGREGH